MEDQEASGVTGKGETGRENIFEEIGAGNQKPKGRSWSGTKKYLYPQNGQISSKEE